jgi:hypothetical protein
VKKVAVFFFTLWLLTSYYLVFAWATIRQKDAAIAQQRGMVEGAHNIAQQVIEQYNRRGH